MGTFEILTELSNKWNTLNDQTKAGLSEAIAGKYQYNIFNAMMSNWEQALKYQQEYNDGFTINSSINENKKYTDSIEGRIVTLQESLRTLVTTTISTDMFKDLISGLTVVVDGINNVIKAADDMGIALPVAFGALSGMFNTIKFNAVDGGFDAINEKAKQTSQNIQNANSNSQGFFKTLSQGFSESKFGKFFSGLGNGFKDLKTQLSQVSTVGGKAKTVISAIGKSTAATKVATLGANVAMTALNTAFYGLIAIGVQKIFEGIYKEVKKNEILIEKLNDQISETQSNISSNTSDLNSLTSIADEYEELAKKTKLSSDEQERFNELTNEIAEIMPDLVIGYDEDGNPILALNDSLDDAIVKLKETIKLEREALEQEQNRLGTANTKEIKKYKQDINLNANKTQGAFNYRIANISEALKSKNFFGQDIDLETRLAKLSDAMDKSESDYNEYREKLLEADEKYESAAQTIHQKIKNNLTDELAGIDGSNVLSDKTTSALYEFMNTLDYGELNLTQQRQITKGFAELGVAIEEGTIKLEDYEKVLSDANANYQATGDMDAYVKSVKSVADELSEVTGVSSDTWTNVLTQQFTGLDYAEMKLASFLKSYNKTYADLQNQDDIAIKLKEQFDEVNEFIDKIATDGGGDITYDLLIDITDGEMLTNLPNQIRDVINAVTSDGTLTDEEKTLVLNLSTTIANGEEISDETYEQIQKILTGEEFEITEPLKIGSTEISVEELKNLQEYFKDQEVTVDIKTNDEALEELKNSVRNSVEYLDIYINLDRTGQKHLEEFMTFVETLDLDKDLELDIATKASEGDLEGILDLISNLPEKQQVQIITQYSKTYGITDEERALVQSAIDKGNITARVGIDFESNGAEGVKQDEDEVTDGAKSVTKKTYFTETGAFEVKSEIGDLKTESKKPITITTIFKKVYKTIKDASDEFGETYGRNYYSGSVGTFDNVSSDPTQVEQTIDQPVAQVETFSNISASPVDSGSQVSTPSTTPTLGQKVKSLALKPFGSIGSSTTNPTKINITKTAVNKALEYSIELFQELQNRIDKVNNKLDLLGSKMEKAVGTEKIAYLEKQNELYEEQQKLQKELYDSLSKEKVIIRDQLKGYGFTFDSQGNLRSYEEILTKLESAADKASEASSNYSGKSDSKKESLQKSADKASEKLEKVKKLTQEYLKLQYDELPNAEKEWQDLANSIKENEDEIEKLVREDKLYKFVNRITELNNQLDISSNKLDIIDAKLSNAYGSDEITLTKQKLELLNEQLLKQQEIMDAISQQIPIYQQDLAKYGATFDDEGSISNYDEILNSLQNSGDKEKVQDLIDEYIEKVNQDLPEAEKSYEELKNNIIDIQKESLEKTQEIEQKITDMIQDQLDKRKQAYEEQADKEIELINKQKEAYQNARDEEDYEKELSEQKDKIAKLKKDIELAKKDNSLSGRAKLEELMEELKEENESLNDMVQDRTDELMNKMFDEEVDKIQNNSDKAIEELEKEFTDQRIAEIVEQALTTGIFTDLDGNIMSLQDALVDFAETSGEALGIMGDILKNEIVGNLESAMNYAKEYQTIMDNLQLKSYGKFNYGNNVQTTSQKNIVLGDTNIIINGNADSTTVDKIKAELDNYMQDIINKI